MKNPINLKTLGILLLAAPFSAQAATIVTGDVTTNLTNTLFIDQAATGGNDTERTDAMVAATYTKTFSYGTGAGFMAITGFGFAAPNAPAQSNATSLTLSFTYFGLNGVSGGGDDVFLGSATVGYTFAAAGEYYVNFDAPTAGANIDGLGTTFGVSLLVNNAVAGVETIRMKTAGAGGAPPKLSVAGTFTPVPEPSTALLGALGALALLRRRR